MSDAAPVPFSEPGAGGARPAEAAAASGRHPASTMADIGPAYSFFFGFGFLVVTAGVRGADDDRRRDRDRAAGGHAIQFSSAHPRAGGFIWFSARPSAGPARSRRRCCAGRATSSRSRQCWRSRAGSSGTRCSTTSTGTSRGSSVGHPDRRRGAHDHSRRRGVDQPPASSSASRLLVPDRVGRRDHEERRAP